MPSSLHRGSPVKGATFLATTVGGSNVDNAYAFSLFQSAMEIDLPLELEIYGENCHVDDGRNRLVRDFLQSDCSQLVFLDSDVKWEPKDLKKLIEYDKEIVAGIYPLKQGSEGYPCRLKEGKIISVNGLIEVDGVPTGFLKIKREVLEKLSENADKFPAKDDKPGKSKIPIIFERSFIDGKRMGGDYTFCEKAKANGYKIYIDPEMRFSHFGQKAWTGSYGTFLRKTMGNGLEPYLNELRLGTETIDTLMNIWEMWNNDCFQASPEFLYKCILEARESKTDIIECGSGITTLCMAVVTKNKIISLEHDPSWLAYLQRELDKYNIKNVELVYAPIKDRWYGVDKLPETDLIICDGPPRAIADRNNLQAKIKSDCSILVDDWEEKYDWGFPYEKFGDTRECAKVRFTV